MRLAVACCSVVGASVLVAGCAQSGFDPVKLQRQLQDAGVPAAQAQCVTDGMQTKFDLNQLASHTEPTDRERATTRAVIEQCGVKLP